MANLEDIARKLSELTVMEAVELSRLLEQKWGVSASASVVTMTETVPQVEEAVEEQTEFTVVLSTIDPTKKIAVIKEIRTITGLGLKEAKDLVESAPRTIRETVSKVDALKIKEQVEAAGGTIELQ